MDVKVGVGRAASHDGAGQGGFAHFGQHKHRAAHAEWAKQRAVAGFVDACVEKWHVGEGTGKVCSKPLKWAFHLYLGNLLTIRDGRCQGISFFIRSHVLVVATRGSARHRRPCRAWHISLTEGSSDAQF